MDELALIHAIEVHEEAEVLAARPPRRFHVRENPFNLSEHQFIRTFRLTKDLTQNLCNLVTPYIIAPSRTTAIDVQTKVLIALRFFATGSYQLDQATNIYLAVSQSSVCRAIKDVVNALNQPEIFNAYVRFPQDINEMNVLRTQFYNTFGFPGVIGCLDCAHVAIFPPNSNDPLHPEHIYVNRKQYHSINIQLICDSKLRILNVNARFPGSSNDSFIWNNSNVKQVMENLHRNGRNDFCLLGDAGYALRPWCLTPLERDLEPGTPEERYNRSHKTTRSIIERCNGVLKMRFRCLLKHRVLHYKPTVASKIINACVVLHNMCIDNNIAEPEINEEDENLDYGMLVNHNIINEDNEGVGRVNPDLEEARRMQQRLILNYFCDNE